MCSFTVAVNDRKGKNKEQTATFFDVSAWNQLADICGKYLDKGSKVCVVGPVSVRTYEGNDGKTRASISVNANEVEFLNSRSDNNNDNNGGYPDSPSPEPVPDYTPQENGFTNVSDEFNSSDDLPF